VRIWRPSSWSSKPIVPSPRNSSGVKPLFAGP
jgi:hypothetical protein